MNKYHISFSTDEEDVFLAQEFRGKLFRGGALDHDALDDEAVHGIVRNGYGRIVCVFRMLELAGDEIEQSYSAQFYDLNCLKGQNQKALELGRFCIDPEYSDPDIVRLAWGALTNYVVDNNIDLLFGCSSFHGADTESHVEALALLKERYLAPQQLMPKKKAPKVFEFAKKFREKKPNLKLAMAKLPPLLRSYLTMGGWVSDHAVIDNDLNTVHVFTGVEINKIPLNRLKTFLLLGGKVKPRV